MINWHKYPDEKPEMFRDCLIVSGGVIDTRWIGLNAALDDSITHWVYVSELPLPKDI